MGRRIYAIAWTTLRFANRSKVMAWMLCLLAIIVIATPATLRGDGSMSGWVQIQLTYALGLVMITLGAATLWFGSAAVSQEITDRSLLAVASTPVHGAEIWTGKWLGLMLMNAFLLTAAGTAVYGMLRWNLSRVDGVEDDRLQLREDVLVARRRIAPSHPDVGADWTRRVEQLRRRVSENGELAESVARHVADAILLRQHYSAAVGETVGWVFQLPALPSPDRPLRLRFQFDVSTLSTLPVAGEWRIGAVEGRPGVHLEVEQLPRAPITIRAPAAAVSPDLSLAVRFTNRSAQPVTVLFEPDTGAELFVVAGSFESNFVRTLLILAGDLALLTAIGLTAGSLFSFPVAAFVSVNAALILGAAPSIAETAFLRPGRLLEGGASHLLDAYVTVVLGIFRLLLSPLNMPHPLDALGSGLVVSWRDVGGALLIKVAGYGTALGGFGSWVLSRRELGAGS